MLLLYDLVPYSSHTAWKYKLLVFGLLAGDIKSKLHGTYLDFIKSLYNETLESVGCLKLLFTYVVRETAHKYEFIYLMYKS